MTELPRGWRQVRLEEVSDIVMGQSPPGSSYNETGEGWPFFQGKAEFGERYPKVKKWTTAGNKHALSGDILISVRAPVGPTNIAEVDCVIGRGLAAIRANDSTNQTYLLWTLRSLEAEITAKGVGTTFSSISGGALRGTSLFLPPLVEQERIVEILEEQFGRLDGALASVKAVRKRAQAFRRSLLQAAFHGALSGGDDVVLPTDWSLLPLDQVSEVRLGRQRSPRNHSGPQMRPYLRAANVTWKGIDLTDVKTMNFTDDELGVFRLKPGDILVSEASGSPNEVGKAAVFQGEIDGCCFQNTLLRVRSNSVDPRYLLHFLTGVALSGAYAAESRGVGINHLGRARLASWMVPIAPPGDQREIAEFLDEQFSRLDAALKVVEQLEVRLASERRSLLHAAFAGELTAQWRENDA